MLCLPLVRKRDLKVDGENTDILTIPANSSKEFVITLSNPNNRVARFNFYYRGDLPSGVDAGYIEKDGYNITPPTAGINLESEGAGSSNIYLVKVSNISDSEVTLTLGVGVGLDYNDLTLPSNGNLFRKIKTTGLVSEVLKDDIMNRLNYTDPEQTFITGEDPNNYIWYSGKLWRAVSIDPSDNSVKLITQWNISAIPYNSVNNSAFSGSYMEMWLNDTSVDGFLGNLRAPESFIKMNSVWNATEAIDTTKPPETAMVTDAVGLLNLYEYTMSCIGTTYNTGYLNNGLEWWSLTPSDSANIYYVSYIGDLSAFSTARAYGIRPVINLKSSIKIIDGAGTSDDPYRLEGDKDANLSGTLLNTRYSGEYLAFGTGENTLYRIVSHETEGLTKITSAEPLKKNYSFITSIFDINSNINYSNSVTISIYLNEEYLQDYVGNDYINMIENNTTWYLGKVGYGANYCLAKYKDESMVSITTSTIAKIGLLRLGELEAGQFERYLEKGVESPTKERTVSYSLLTPYSSTNMRDINAYGSAGDYVPNTIRGIKPAMNLKSNVIITGGDGTKENPFTIALQ